MPGLVGKLRVYVHVVYSDALTCGYIRPVYQYLSIYHSRYIYIYIVTELNPVLTTSAVCADLGWGKPPMSMLFDEPSSSPKCV